MNLTGRTAVKPLLPSNWKRNIPETKNVAEIWNILKPFLESPGIQVFEYRKAQSYRSQMESAIKRVTIDLKMQTITKGPPHTLKITKTQSAYEKELKNWQEDICDFRNIKLNECNSNLIIEIYSSLLISKVTA